MVDLDLAAREDRVRLLLTSLYDYLPAVSRFGEAERRGFVPGQHQALCPDCDFNGFVSKDCETCGGKGYLIDSDHDPYDTGRDFSWMNVEDERKREWRRRDELIVRLRRDQVAREGGQVEAFSWEVRRRVMERHGDYRQLRLALGRLSALCPALYESVVDYYFSGRFEDPPRTPREGLAVAFLSRWMRGPVRVPPWLLVESRRLPTFDQLVVSGASSRRIAMVLGLSQKKVKRMLKVRLHVQAA